jgi:hypothetical protein
VAVDSGVAMPYELFADLDELLAPETLSELVGSAIGSVRCLPFTGGHSASGSHLLAIDTNCGEGPRLVLKRVSREWDWIMRATDDDRGREALAWTSGLLDRLPAEVMHPILACARDADGWAILMHDVGNALFPPHDPYVGTPIAPADDDRILDALAALHVAFWEEPEAADPALGFCTPEQRYRSFSPETGRREVGGPDFYPGIIRDGWELLPTLVDPGVANFVTELAADPGPLAAALTSYPQTVVHGDPRPPNLGLQRNGATTRVVLLDWQFLGPGTPGADVTWYLHCAGPSRRSAKETGIACYRDRLARRLGPRFDERWWQPQLELSLLGQMLRCAHDLAWAAVRHESASTREWARAGLVWWSEQAKAGAQWL